MISRRNLIQAVTTLAASIPFVGAFAQGTAQGAGQGTAQGTAQAPAAPMVKKPRPAPLDPELVKKFVIAAHVKLDDVKTLLAQEPRLLNACVDWGGGDFETALEGAGHMGHRDIAEFLVKNGARLNIFASAMLGELEVVKSLITANPELKDSKGPHGITLMRHAEAGKERSAAVVEYLKSLS